MPKAVWTATLVFGVLLVGACVRNDGSDQALSQRQDMRNQTLRTNLEGISTLFEKEYRASSAFSEHCGAGSASELLVAYFDAVVSHQVNSSMEAIHQLQSRLACYAAADLDEFQRAFASSAFVFKPTGDFIDRQHLNAILVSPAFLLLDSRRAWPTEAYVDYRDWFAKNARSISAGLHHSNSVHTTVGLITKWNGTLFQIPLDKTAMLLDGLESRSISLLDCPVQEMVLIDDAADPKLVCPNRCPDFESRLEDLSPEERAQLRASLPEYSQFCSEISEALDASATIRPGVLQCVREFLDQTDSSVACLADRFSSGRGPETLFERIANLEESHTIEALRTRQRCWLSDLSPEEQEEYEDLTDLRKKINDTIDMKKREIDENKSRIDDLNRNPIIVQPPPGSPLLPMCFSCDEVRQLQRENVDLQGDIDDLARRRGETGDRWRELNRRFRNSGTRNCPPGVDGCGDECGLGAGIMDPITNCLFDDDQNPLDDGTLTGPNPELARPNPEAPQPPPDNEALAMLQSCVDGVIEQQRPAGQSDCSSTVRCAFDLTVERAPGENCTCLEEVETTPQRNRRFCEWVATPDPRDPDSFECLPLGETPGQTGPIGPDPTVFLELRVRGDLLRRR